MRYSLLCVLLNACIVGFLAPASADAAGPKPIAVLSLTSHQDLKGDTGGIGELAKVGDLPTWLSSMLKLFDEGKGARGLDATRPWGVVLQLGNGLSAYGFLPVSDAEHLLLDLDTHISGTEELADGTFRVTGTQAGKQVFARMKGDWIYVADRREDLSDVADDPTSLLSGLDKKYDVALCVETKNIPEREGRAIINLLGDKFGSVIRQHASEDALHFLGEALNASEQVTMGWKKH